jgi:hypothetical protein
MRVLAALIAAFCLISAPALADPPGRYNMTGTNPGSGEGYSGTVSINRTGDTYQVVWVVGNQRFEGTGIGTRDFLAVSYRSGNQTGLALYSAEGDDWEGVWTYAGGRQMGTERWIRR